MTVRKPPPKRKPVTPRQEESRPASGWRLSTVVVSNLSTLAGVGLSINELVFRPEIRQSALAVCVLLVIGSQAAEDVLLRVIDKILSARDGGGQS